MRFNLDRFAAVTLGLAMMATSAACGNAGDASEYGAYPSHQVNGDYDQQPSRARGVLAESLRLGERIVYATDIDPELTTGRGGGVSADFHGLNSTVISAPEANATNSDDVLGAFGAMAANKPYSSNDDQQTKFLGVSIIAFTDEQKAAAAAGDMARADFDANTDNAPVAVEAYPAALSHWRPGVPTLGSIMAWKSLVIRVYAQLPDPDLGRLVDVVTKTYQRQLDLLSTFTPTAASELAKLPLDPDHMLPRLVKTGDYTPDDHDFAVYGPHAYSALLGSPATDFGANAERGVGAIAVSYNKHLFRLRDEASAEAYAGYLAGMHSDADYAPIRNGTGNSAVTCYQATKQLTQTPDARRFRCLVVRGEYVAMVYSNADTDARELAAAQYSVMGGAA